MIIIMEPRATEAQIKNVVNHLEENDFKKPDKAKIQRFVNALEKRGINATVRRELGSDISASCGQLRRAYGKHA